MIACRSSWFAAAVALAAGVPACDRAPGDTAPTPMPTTAPTPEPTAGCGPEPTGPNTGVCPTPSHPYDGEACEGEYPTTFSGGACIAAAAGSPGPALPPDDHCTCFEDDVLGACQALGWKECPDLATALDNAVSPDNWWRLFECTATDRRSYDVLGQYDYWAQAGAFGGVELLYIPRDGAVETVSVTSFDGTLRWCCDGTIVTARVIGQRTEFVECTVVPYGECT